MEIKENCEILSIFHEANIYLRGMKHIVNLESDVNLDIDETYSLKQALQMERGSAKISDGEGGEGTHTQKSKRRFH